MTDASLRSSRHGMVSYAIEGFNGWDRDPYRASAIHAYKLRFPNLPLVADGREETGNTRRGRGTTLIDLFRVRKDNVSTKMQLACTDMLSIKTEDIPKGGKLPSKLSLATGNVVTQEAIREGAELGAPLATLVYASETDCFGRPMEQGLALFLDLAPIIREGIAPVSVIPYRKGQAPEAYYKWSAPRPCGGKRGSYGTFGTESVDRAELGREFPYVDEQGRRWVAADKVCYLETCISLSAMGINRGAWDPVSLNELPDYLESHDWNSIAGY